MDENGQANPTRRTVIVGIGIGAASVGLGTSVTASSHEADVTVTINNIGSNAWEVTAVDGDEDVAPTGEENPTLTLTEGTRYSFENEGSGAHPLAFRDSDDDELLSQSGDGSLEDNDDIDWEDEGETATFTVTEELAGSLDNYVCTAHPSMVGDIESTEETNDAALTFPNQATASSTFTAADDDSGTSYAGGSDQSVFGTTLATMQGETTPAVLVEDVTTTEESYVVVTYEDGEDLVIAGVEAVDPELEEAELVISVEDDGGFPGPHVAHIIPADDASEAYEPGDVVSADTAEAVVTNDEASVYQATLEFADQEADEPVQEGDVMATVDVTVNGDDEAGYVVDIHPTDADGELVGDEFVGATDVLTGESMGAEIVAEQVPDDGEFNELPFAGTDDFVAMIHYVGDEADEGDVASPGEYPVLPNIDADEGPVPGGVTDIGTLTAADEDDPDEDDMDAEDDTDDDPADGEDETDAEDDVADDEGPGFGPIVGLAGVGGAAAYAARKLRGSDSLQTEQKE